MSIIKDSTYDMFKPEESYYLLKSEVVDDSKKPYFVQFMVWRRINEEGQEVVDPRMYYYGKN